MQQYNTFTPSLHLVPFCQLRTPQNPSHTSYTHKPTNKHNTLQLASFPTTQPTLQTCQHGISYRPTQYCSHHSLPLQDNPYLPCLAATKAHNIHNPPQHATQTQHRPCTPQLLHTKPCLLHPISIYATTCLVLVV